VIVFAATSANPLKIARMRELGAEVRLEGADFDGANAAAKRFAAETDAVFVEDAEIPEVGEGAGTIARELTEAGYAFDAFYVPVGGGSLANGIGCWLKAHRPACRVIGVCAAGAPALHASWHSGRLIETPAVDTIADGVAVRVPSAYAMRQLARNLDDMVLVDDEQILAAMRLIHRATGVPVEPAGAVGFAALIARKELDIRAAATLICGANLTPEQKRCWLGA
jgi:threonine dehydratase